MTNPEPIPRAAVQGVGGGLLLMAFFTCMWASWAMPGIPAYLGIPILVIFVAFSVVFVVQGVALLRHARRFTDGGYR